MKAKKQESLSVIQSRLEEDIKSGKYYDAQQSYKILFNRQTKIFYCVHIFCFYMTHEIFFVEKKVSF